MIYRFFTSNKIVHLIFLCFICINLTESTLLKSLIIQLLKEVQPNQVTIFSDFKNGDTSCSCSYQSILCQVIRQVSTATVDLIYSPSFIKWNDSVIEYHRNVTAPLRYIVLSENAEIKVLENLQKSLSAINILFIKN